MSGLIRVERNAKGCLGGQAKLRLELAYSFTICGPLEFGDTFANTSGSTDTMRNRTSLPSLDGAIKCASRKAS